MSKRLELDEIFCEIVNITEPDGDRHVYFNPPESVKMKYPAIKYKLKTMDALYANDSRYKSMDCYEATLIEKEPDSKLLEKVLALPYCSYDRHYKVDNLNHHTITIYK